MHLVLQGSVTHFYHLHHDMTQGGRGKVLDVAGVFPRTRRLDSPHKVDSGSSHPLVQDIAMVAHPPGIMWCLHHLHVRSLDRTIKYWYNNCVASTLISIHSWRLSLGDQYEGTITNYKLELDAIVLHEDTILSEIPKVVMAVPHFGFTTLQLYPVSHRRCPPSIQWLWTFFSSIWFNQGYSSLTFLHSITHHRKTSCRTMTTTFYLWLTLTFSPTCHQITHSWKKCGDSTPCFRRYFHAWSPYCTGIHAIRDYKICDIDEDVQIVGRLLIHPVGKPWSTRSISVLSWDPPGECTKSLTDSQHKAAPRSTW